MAHRELRQKAVELRKKGYSYSQIKSELGLNKSTLHYWLYNMPLSEERIRALRDWNPIRIERCRNTKRKKKEDRLALIYKEVSKELGNLSSREVFIAGLFLYWGEGNKTGSSIGLTNTNPKMLHFYIYWLALFGIEKKQLKAKLHLYSDMDIKKQERFWSKELGIPLSQFTKSYIKKTKFSAITYGNGFGQGTCSITFQNVRLFERIRMGLKYIQEISP